MKYYYSSKTKDENCMITQFVKIKFKNVNSKNHHNIICTRQLAEVRILPINDFHANLYNVAFFTSNYT